MQLAPRPWLPLGTALGVAAAVALLSACGGAAEADTTSAAAAADAASAAAAPGAKAQSAAVAATTPTADDGPPALANLLFARNESGLALTFSLAGVVDRIGPFFQSLGSNGRSCSSCHVQAEGWTVTPRGLQERYASSGGTDPIFRTNDGANAPTADVSTPQSRRGAYSMLLNRGLIRVGLPIPDGAEFELAAVDDPYGYASAKELSLFRRPLPTTNLKFLSTVMWDGRETFKDPAATDCVANTSNCFAPIHFDLADQSNTATTGHAQAASPISQAQREAIVTFETALFTAQVFDERAGMLTARGARGGPVALSNEDFHFGINDTLAGDYQTHAPFTPTVMTLYDAWTAGATAAQRAVARGQALFNSKPIQIRGVKGLNDDLGIDTLAGTCTTCHNTPNAGDHSIPLPLDIGLTDLARRTPDLPLYTLRNKATSALIQTTDPGRALVTGKWRDVGRFKGPILRALAARAPYFHNGSAADLGQVVDFYNQRFAVGFSAAEKADLVAFLRSL